MAKNFYTVVAAVAIGAMLASAAPAPQWSRALESPWGKDLQRCKTNWAAISDRENPQEVARCLHLLVLAAAPKTRNAGGIPAAGIAQMDPLKFPGVVNIGGKPGQPFKGELTNSVISGIPDILNLEHTKASYDPSKKEFTLTIRSPKTLKLGADYKVELNPAAIFGQQAGGAGSVTTGRVTGIVEGVVATQVVGLGKANNGELRVRSSRSTFEINNVSLNFKGANPSDPLTGLLNAALSARDTAMLIIDELRPTINNALAQNIGALFHRGWRVLDQL